MKKVKVFYLFILVSIAWCLLMAVVFQTDSTSLTTMKQRLKKTTFVENVAMDRYLFVHQRTKKKTQLKPTKRLHKSSTKITNSYYFHNKENERRMKQRQKLYRTSLEIVDSSYDQRTGTHCDFQRYWGEMCPKLYTELGGRCDLINGTFDCPDIRHKSKYTHRQSQLVITRMLRIFDLLAQKHNITYWIAHGTLMGAARHQGFIPWDYDVDIHMPLEDYVKFFQVAAKELPADIFFQNCISDPELAPDEVDIDGYNLPVHEIVGIYERTWNPRLRDRNSCIGYCLAVDCKWHDGLMMDIFVSDPDIYSGSVYPLKRMKFEGFLFPIPNSWKEDLALEYGDDWSEVLIDESPDIPFDTFNGCEIRS